MKDMIFSTPTDPQTLRRVVAELRGVLRDSPNPRAEIARLVRRYEDDLLTRP